MTAIDISRQTDIVKPWEHKTPINLIGVGATGSRIFMALIELGFTNIRVYDFDTVEAHNLANQAFTHAHIGMAKVDALRELYKTKTGEEPPVEMQFNNTRVPDINFPIAGNVFLLTDSMASRKEIYHNCIKNNDAVYNVVETRMASTHGNVFTFNSHNMFSCEAWERTLSDDESTEVSLCGTPISIGMTASLVANYAVWQFIHVLLNDNAGSEQIDLFFKPFFTVTKEKLNA